MAKITIIEGNSSDKNNVRVIMVKGEKGEQGDLNHTDIVDNLTSTASDKVLSAKQGKILKDLVDENSTNIATNTLDISENTSNISTEIEDRTNADANLQSQISGLASGSPLVASSTSGMTDTTKIYVNTTDGYWYYYDGDSWEQGGVYQTAQGTTDKTLSTYDLSADSKIVGDFITQTSKPKNYFNKYDTNNNFGKYLKLDTTNFGDLASNSSMITTDYISVKQGEILMFPAPSSFYGGNADRCVFYASDNSVIRADGVITDSIVTVTVPENAIKFRVSISYEMKDTFMIIKKINNASYPNNYIEYNTYDLVNKINSKNTNFIENKSVNLFDVNDPDIVSGKKLDSSGNENSDSLFSISGYIPVKYNEYYSFVGYRKYYGQTSIGRAVFMYDINKNYLGVKYGEWDTNYKIVTVQITNEKAYYIRFNFYSAADNMKVHYQYKEQYPQNQMFVNCEAANYPTNYTKANTDYYQNSYSDYDESSNPLLHKSVLFLGDSICQATYDNYIGYAGRVGRNNSMKWVNFGDSGATISTANSSKCIATTDFRYLGTFDYIILEGGGNDADRIGDSTGETKPAAFGSYSLTNWGTDDEETYYGFNIDTFCGALEFLLKRLIVNFPNTKIGYVVCHKMGVTSNYSDSVNNRAYFFKTAKEICEKWGVQYIDLWNKCKLNPRFPIFYTDGATETNYYVDGTHLYDKGYELVYPIIEDFMKGL